MSASLVVTVVDHEGHRSKRHEFRRSPVRIGRDPGNELALPYKFVSSWHAVAKFDARGARVEDLGGANGLTVAGQRVPSGGRVEVRGRAAVTIGTIELIFEHKADEVDEVDEPRTARPRAAGGRAPTPAPTPPEALHERDHRSAQGAIGDEPPEILGSGTQAMNLSRLHAAVLRLRPLYARLEQAHRAWEAAFAEALAELEGGRDRGEATLLRREFPPLALGTSEGPAALDGGGAEFYAQAELGAVGQAAEQLLPGLRAPGNIEETRRFLERCADALRGFSAAAVALQELLHRQGGEVGVRIEGDDNPLLVAESDEDVLRYLLDWRVRREERGHQLAQVFAAATAHLRGALLGAIGGGRRVGEELSPRSIERSVAAAWPTRAGALWRRFEERHEAIFGDGDEGLARVFRAAVGKAIRDELTRAGVRTEAPQDDDQDEEERDA